MNPTLHTKKFFSIYFLLVLLIGNLYASVDSTDPSTLKFTLDQCVAYTIDDSNLDFSEFTADIVNTSDLTISVIGDHLYRDNPTVNSHSCTFGPNGTDAMCVSADPSCDYPAGDEQSVKFDILLTPENGQLSILENLNFFESAPDSFVWINGGSGPNNFPIYYGIRILKNGTIIYEEEDISTTQDWTLETFDFSDNALFTFNTPTTFSFELIAYCPMNTNSPLMSIWDLDEICLSASCDLSKICVANNEAIQIEGGMVFNSDSSNVETACVGDLVFDISNNSSATNDDYYYVVVDANDNVLEVIDASGVTQLDLNNIPAGVCRVYGWSTKNPININSNNTLADLEDDLCEELSENFITVTKLDPMGGSLSGGPFNFCVGDGHHDFFIDGDIILTNETGADFSYFLTDASGTITNISSNPTNFNFENSSAGTCFVYHIASYGSLQNYQLGSNLNSIAGCYDISNSIEITKQSADGGVLTGGPFSFCIGDGQGDFIDNNQIILTGATGPTNQWVVSDEFGNILGLPTNISDVNFEAAGTGKCYIRNIAYNDIMGLNIGDNLMTVMGCHDLSNAIEVNRTESPNVSLVGGTNGNGGIDTTCGDDNGSATASATNGTAPYSYSWSNGQATAAISGLAAGTYTVTVTDDAGCTDTTSVTIGGSSSPIASTSSTDTTCGENNGSATASATSGTAPYSYSWSNGQATAAISGLAAGTYTVTATDDEGCTDTTSVTIDGSTNPSVSVSGNDTTCGDSNGSAMASTTSGVAPYSYSWSNNETTATISDLSAGTYTVTVTDDAGCTDTASVTIDPSTSPIAAINSNDTTCGDNNGTATASATSGTAPYTYNWSNGSSSAMISNLAPGNYAVTVTDDIGCTDNTSVTIEDSSSPMASTTSSDTNCGDDDGTATASATSGTAPYTYSWSNGSSSAMISNLAAGTYTVTVTDDAGCTDTTTASVASSMGPTVSIDGEDTFCGFDNGSVNATATGGNGNYTYSWSNGSSGASLSDLAAGNYSVTVTDAVGCTDENSFTVGDSQNENNGGMISCIDGSPVKNICEDDADLIFMALANNVGENSSWIIEDSNGEIISLSSNPIDISALSVGSYNIYHVSYDSDCGTTTIDSDQNVVRTGAVTLDLEDPNCAGLATFFVNPVPSTGTFDLPIKEFAVTITEPGFYNFSPAESCDFVFNLYPQGGFDINNSCSTNNLLAFGGYSVTNMNQSQKGGAYLTPGTYQLIVCSTSFSCTDNIIGGALRISCVDIEPGTMTSEIQACHDLSNPVQLNINPQPEINIDNTTNTSCGENNGTATASATSGSAPYTYSWSNGQATAAISGLAAGTYTVTVTDDAGCTDTTSVTIDGSTNPSVSISGNNTTCGDSDGSATASTTSGVAPYMYAWSNNETTATITGLAAGTYSVTVEDSNGCTDTASVTIDPSTSPTATVNSNNTTCGHNNGTATASAASGTAPYTYNWSNGSSSAMISNLAPGNYTVTVTDDVGCTDTTSVTIGDSSSPIAATTSTDTNCGTNNGTATASATSGTAPYTYSWSNGQATAAISGLAAGTYTVTVTDDAGCTDTTSVTIDGSTNPSISVSGNDTTCGDSDGSATASTTSGVAPYMYAWSNNETTATITGLAAGTYSVTVEDSNGCTDTASVTIDPSTSPTAAVNSNNTTCGDNNGTATASATSGTAPYTYNWSNGSSSAMISGLAAGTFTVTVTDDAGCTDSASVTIGGSSSPIAATTSTDTNCGTNDGTATASATSGTAPYTYNWSNGQASAAISGLAAGTYTVTVTDDAGCTDTTSVTIDGSTNPSVSVSGNDTTCGDSNGSAMASTTSGVAPYMYAWSNNETTATITGLAAGTYSVTVEDSNGCTDTASVTIDPSTSPTAAVNSNNTTCGDNNGTATASATSGSAPYTYNWSNGSSSAMISNLAPGNYTVTVTDDVGCTDTTSVTIGDSSSPSLSASSTETNCGDNDGTATASATSGTAPYTYNWSNGQSTANISGLAAGTFTVTVTDDAGCTDAATVMVGGSTNPSVSVSGNDTTCGDSNGSAMASTTSGVAPYMYAWSNNETTATITNLAAGTYSVTVEDSNGCTDTASVTIDPSTSPTATVNSNNTTCGDNNGTATASATSGTAPYTYNWSNGSSSAMISNLAPGNYTVTVTDDVGCTDTTSVTIGGSSSPSLSASSTETNCGDNDGTATASATSGTAPYTYNWSNGQSTANISGLAAGTFTVTVTDDAGCTDTATVMVGGSTNPTVSVSGNDTTCGDSNGSAMASTSSGVAPYSYNWSNNETTANISGLAAGTYTVTATDANNCSSTANVTIGNSSSPAASVTSNDTTCGDNDGTANASVTSGTAPYTYSWSNGSNTAMISNLAPGNYTLTVTDAAGCTDTASVTIDGSSSPSLSTSSTETNCGDNDGTATASATSGTAPYTYNWSNGQSTATISGLAAGTYTVTVTDDAGCTDTTTVMVGGSTTPMVTINGNDTTCGDSNGNATATTTSGVAPYTYVWSNNQTTANISGLAAGTYTVTATDANNCSSTANVTIGNSSSPAASITSNDTTCGLNDGSANASVTSGIAPYTYSWSNGSNTAMISNLAPGNYTLTVTDAASCTDVTMTTIDASDSADGGTLTGGPFTFCLNDNDPDMLESGDLGLSGTMGSTQYVITDLTGMILGITSDITTVDFANAGPGSCLIWNLSHIGSVDGLVVGNNALTDLNGCYDLSNSVQVDRADPKAELVNQQFAFCVGDGIEDRIKDDSLTIILNTGSFSTWVVTDTAGLILGVEQSINKVNFDGAGPERCLIWLLSYEDGLTGNIVDNYLTDIMGCFDLSNSITVNRLDCGDNTCESGNKPVAGMIKYDMESCFSNSTNNSASDYTELTGSTMMMSPECGSVDLLKGHIFRNNPTVNGHSCTPGVNGTVGVCVTASDDCTYDSSDDGKVIIEIALNPLPGKDLTVSAFEFYELAPLMYNFIDGPTGLNNYPSLYGVRILKDGVEIFSQTDIATSQDWSLEQFDFAGNPDFTVSSSSTFTFELLGYCTIDQGSTVKAWDLDDIKITVSCDELISGGTLSGGPFDFCVDGISDFVSGINVTNTTGGSSQWLVTDANGNILALPADPTAIDFDNSGFGSCFIWNITGDNISNLSVGANVMDLAGCYNISNAINVLRRDCDNNDILLSELSDDNSIELTNYGLSSVNVSEYYICDESSCQRVGDMTLVCGGNLVINPGQSISLTGILNIAGMGGEISLFSSNHGGFDVDHIVDYVIWGTGMYKNGATAIAAGIWTSGDTAPSFSSLDNLLYDGTGNTGNDWFIGNPSPCTTNANPAGPTISYRVYPNPSTDIIQIAIDTNLEDLSDIKIFDGQGQLINTIKVDPFTRVYEVDIRNILDGIYHIKVQDNKQSISKSFIKIK